MTTQRLRRAYQAVCENERRLRALVENMPAVVCVKDLAGRYCFVNREFERTLEIARTEVEGRVDGDCFPAETAAALCRHDREVSESGLPVEYEIVLPQADGPRTYLSVKFPLCNRASHIEAVGAIFAEITERIRTRQALERTTQRLQIILNAVSDGILELDHEGRTTFANRAASEMTGWNVEDLLRQSRHDGIHHARHPERPHSHQECPMLQTLHDGMPRHEDREMFWRCDGTSFPVDYTVSPTWSNGKIGGAVVTFRDLTDQSRRRQMEQQLDAADVVQRRLFPDRAPELPGFEIAGAAYPAEKTCGDYFDFIPLDDATLAVAVGDVSGHGFGPALHMVEMRAYLRAYVRARPDLEDALRQVNQLLVDDFQEETFVTLFLARLCPPTRTLEYVAAAHEGYVVRNDGDPVRLRSTGPPLGMLPSINVQMAPPLVLENGDLIVLPTDGVLETMSPGGELFGWRRTLELVRTHRDRPAAEIVRILEETSRDFACNRPRLDDATVVLIKAVF